MGTHFQNFPLLIGPSSEFSKEHIYRTPLGVTPPSYILDATFVLDNFLYHVHFQSILYINCAESTLYGQLPFIFVFDTLSSTPERNWYRKWIAQVFEVPSVLRHREPDVNWVHSRTADGPFGSYLVLVRRTCLLRSSVLLDFNL